MITKRKPSLEKVSAAFGTSFSVKHYSENSNLNSPPFWHFHPEIELVYVKGGKGKRHIGNHLSYYHSGDLVLIGSMLPHSGFTDRLTRNESETVIQFNEDFLGDSFFGKAELEDIQILLQKSRSGLVFHGETKEIVGQKIENLVQLNRFEKLLQLLEILQLMALSKEYEMLNAEGYTFEVEKTDNDRINIIFDYVQTHFENPIALNEIAALTNMTIPSFCRYFKKISGKTFTQFVNEIRIINACKLLSEDNDTISNIAYNSGFKNFSHFNRQFKSITGKSPTTYRKQIKQMIQ